MLLTLGKKMKPRYYLQIDILKAFAIIAVIITHSYIKLATIAQSSDNVIALTISNPMVTNSIIQLNHITFFNIIEALKIFCIWQAVPIFFVLIGVTWGMSFRRHNYATLKDVYKSSYLKNRLKRLYFPYILLLIISIVIGVIILITSDINIFNYITPRILIGYLPISEISYGSYFIALILEMIFIFPLIYVSYIKFPKLTIISAILIDIFYQCYAFYFNPALYDIFFVRIISAVVIGLWISNQDFKLDKSIDLKNRAKNFLKNYKIFIFLSLIGITYLSLWYFTYKGYISSSFYPIPYLNDKFNTLGYQNVLSFIFAGFLTVIALIVFPNSTKSKLVEKIALIGKASYHIFLIQILYFSLFSLCYLIADAPLLTKMFLILGDVILCVILGLVFYYAEKRLANFLSNYISKIKLSSKKSVKN